MLTDDAGIYFRSDKDKLSIHCLRPRRGVPSGWYHTPEGGWPSIKVTATRGAEAIAREIERRLLPDYRAAWTEAKQRLADTLAFNASTRALVDELAAILRTEPRGQDKDKLYSGGDVYAHLSVQGENVRVEHLSLNRAQAIAFCKLLVEWNA